MRILLLLFPILFVFLVSCAKKEDQSEITTWISGQIVNPKADYITFTKGNIVLDTVPLDANNFFFYETNQIEKGLYLLQHHETQVFYLEPGDSLLLRLNTIEFDESLAFSGRGGAPNNLLIDSFLKNERENKLLPTWYSLSPEEFTRKTDSIRAEKMEEYQDFILRHNPDKDFKEIALASINYDYYSKKELYAMANRIRADKLGDDFFDYRKEIDFDNERLWYYYPYYRFLYRFFEGLTVAKYPPGADRNSFAFNRDKIIAIDSLSKNDSLRNGLTRHSALRFLYLATDSEEAEEFHQLFQKYNNNPSHLKEVENIARAVKKTTDGKEIPKLSLLTTDNTVTDLQEIIQKPTVLYFWSEKRMDQAEMAHSKAAELREKYPEFDFIAINKDSHFNKWRLRIKNLEYDPEYELQFEDPEEAEKTLVISYINKTFIVDKDLKIKSCNSNLLSKGFEELLINFADE